MDKTMSPFALDFVLHDDLRTALESDLLEMDKALATCSNKAVVVLSGSVIEALVVDTLIAGNIISKRDALNLDLGKALEKALNAKLMSQRCFELSTVIRGYRNLIHPGRLVRLSEKVTGDTAAVATALTKMVIAELRESREKSGGLTAKQVVEKIVRDPAAASVISHLLRGMNDRELYRLATERLPQAYILEENGDEFRNHETMASLCKCFHSVFEISSDEAKGKIRKWFYEIYRASDANAINGYGTHFLRIKYLDKNNTVDSSLIVGHLLSRFDDNSEQLLGCLEGISDFLTVPEINNFVDPLVKLSVSGDQRSSSLITNTLTTTVDPIYKALMGRLLQWSKHYKEKGQDRKAGIVDDIILWGDIPF
jgi:hypothetical protein